MKKRTKIKIFSFATVAILILGGYVIESQILLQQSKQQLEYNYRRNLNDLTDYVNDMEFSLKKSTYANTATMRSMISAELLEMSSSAKAAMATLPFSQEKSDKIGRFISQVGDYATALSRKSASGKEIDDKDFENLANLEQYVVKLSSALEEVQAHLSVEKAAVGKVQRLLNNVDAIDNLPNFDDSLDEMAKEFAQFPALLYDGPFSDHILQQKPKFIEGKETATVKEAAEKAAKFLKCNVEDLSDGGTGDNALASYVFLHNTSRIHITKVGGFVSYFKDERHVDTSAMDYEGALKAASDFLHALGIKSFKESYYVINDNTCTINFSYLSEGGEKIICYPDLIKVMVDLKEGGTLEYDATGYLMNHHERKFQTPKLSLEEAKKSVSKNLQIKGYEMAIIPTPGLDEVFCYEFICKDKNDMDVLVYINTDNGMEEQIFILSKSDNGVFSY